jgi:4-amino-4-deoxy-L-arabinose transferase-like glycosyltransferase
VATTVGMQTPADAEPASDSRIHLTLTQNLLAGKGFSLHQPTAITPPLYILFLAGLYGIFQDPAVVRLVQIGLGAIGCLMLYAIGRQLFGHAVAGIAAAIFAVLPLPVYLTGLHLTENLFLPLVMLVLWQAHRVSQSPTPAKAIMLGVFSGLTALTRALFLGFLPFLLVWAITTWGARSRRAYVVFGLVVLGTAGTILPWTIRNFVVLQAVVPVQSNGGMVFWAGNNPHSDGGMVWPTRSTWQATAPPDDGMYGWRDLTVGEENARYVRTALAWIREHPAGYARLLPQKLIRLYGFTRAEDERLITIHPAVLAVHLGTLAATGVGLILGLPRWRELSLLLALIGFTNVSTLMFSGATRYLAPMIPSIALFSALAFATAWPRSVEGQTR